MRILVTGATGFVGRHLVNELVKKHKVLALSRDPDKARDILPENVEIIRGDITDRESLKGLRRKRIDVVYHLAAEIDESSKRLWEINVTGLRNILDVFRNKRLERFIYLSSIGVLGGTSIPAKENFPYNPETRYEASKAEAERIIADYWLKYQIQYTIIRSTIIYGPNKVWAGIINAAKKGFPLIGSGENKFHLIYIDDVVSALVLALSPIARNKTYNIAGPDSLTYKETYNIICKILGSKMPSMKVPRSAAIAFASIYSKVNSNLTVNPANIKRLTRNRIVDYSLAERELGWKPVTHLEKGMRITIKELAKRGMI